MGDQFRKIVRDEVQTGLRQILLPVQGVVTYIAPDGATCSVKIPLPGGGIQQGAFAEDGSYHLLEAVPLPRTPSGLIDAWLAQLMTGIGLGQQPSVLVGFRGGNMHFPFIICFLDLLAPIDTQVKQKVPDRQGAVTNTLMTKKAPTLGASFVSTLPFAETPQMVSGVAIAIARIESAAPAAPNHTPPAAAQQRAQETLGRVASGIRGLFQRSVTRDTDGRYRFHFGIKFPGSD